MQEVSSVGRQLAGHSPKAGSREKWRCAGVARGFVARAAAVGSDPDPRLITSRPWISRMACEFTAVAIAIKGTVTTTMCMHASAGTVHQTPFRAMVTVWCSTGHAQHASTKFRKGAERLAAANGMHVASSHGTPQVYVVGRQWLDDCQLPELHPVVYASIIRDD